MKTHQLNHNQFTVIITTPPLSMLRHTGPKTLPFSSFLAIILFLNQLVKYLNNF